MKRRLIHCLAASVMLAAVTGAESADALKDGFLHPAPETRPGCYWYWINDNISKHGITKDLESMARVGIGRAYIGHIFNHKASADTPVGSVKFMSAEWWDAVQWAVKEAGRCGVEIGFFNSPGWSQSGGPWIKPGQSMRYLDASETVVEGGRKIDLILPVPDIRTFPNTGGMKPVPTGPAYTARDFQDVRVIAFRQPETEAADLDMARIQTASPSLQPITHLFDGSSKTSLTITQKPQVIDFTLDGVTSVQSLRLDPLDHSYTLTCQVAASDDDKTYRELTKHVEQRGHQGPRKMDPVFIPIPETKTKHLRVTLSCSKPTAFAEVSLSRRAVLAHHVRKQLGETSPSTAPPWDTYLWSGQPEPAAGSAVDSSQVVDLSGRMDADGRLVWDAPPGRWVVMRAGMAPTGTQCAPASPEARGLEVDKMSKQHIRSLFDGMVGEFLRRTPAAERKAFKYVIADSYETGPQNWTDGMVEKFEKQYGYSPVRYLPCLQGRVVDSPEITDRFLWDWRRLIAESIARDYVGGLRELSDENGLKLWLENYGHWGFPSEFLLYGSMTDQVGGEFWESGDPLSNVELRAAASCSHTYGRTDVYAEAFTSNRTFRQSPASMKSWTDWAYAAGINHFILHVYIHQPDERKPGIAQWFGTAFNRHNTWFEPGKSFIDHMRRSSVLLKEGRPVIDVAYYIGETTPVMTGPFNPALPDGYDYDHINSDALIHRAKADGGRIMIENGPSYAVLVLPKETDMRPEVAAAIQQLIRDGATVLGPKPVSSPSLAAYPECDAKVQSITTEIWGDVDGRKATSRKHGKGTLHDGVPLDKVLTDLQLQPDVCVEGADKLLCAAAGAGKIGIGGKGGIVFKHRSAPAREIYFLSNTTDLTAEFTASLRVSGRRPDLWNAVTGDIMPATAFSQSNGRTLVPLRLAPSESIFIVLGEPIAGNESGPAASNKLDMRTVTTLDGPWTVRFYGQGAPKETVFDNPTDWSRHPDETIRHYSGTAVYETKFTLADSRKPTVLSLGDVGIIAEVIVNGSAAGSAWTAPWEVNLTDHVKPGENTLQIRVTNTWDNRLIADADKPTGQRQSYISQPNLFEVKAPLLKSGLIGPVMLKQAE